MHRSCYPLFLEGLATMVRPPRKIEGREICQHQEEEEGDLNRGTLQGPARRVQGVHALLQRPGFHPRPRLQLYHWPVRELYEEKRNRPQDTRFYLEQEQVIDGEGSNQKIDVKCDQ